MNYGKLAATGMIVLSLLASVGYFYAKDYKRSLYWLCSAGLIYSVTY